MERDNREQIDRLSSAITDETQIEWSTERSSDADTTARLDALRTIERIAQVYRNPWGTAATDAAPIFTWGHLRVLEQLGQGGGGTVFRAQDPHLRRDVALKLLPEERSGSAVDRQRFVEEARRLARVQHPNILTVHGAEEHDGRVGFWFDLVPGETLEERLRREGSMGAGEVAVIGLDLCRALAAVHQAGLVHGDVKAANVMRDQNGRIVLTDFGAGSEIGPGSEFGVRFGTPLALAPEVFEGAPPSRSTDLYALGVLLFRLATGRYPVEGKDQAALRDRHRSGLRNRLLDLRPDLPSGFAHVIERAIAPEPGSRWRSAGELESALAGTIRGGRTATFRRLAGPVLLGVIAVSLLIWKLPRTGPEPANSPSSSLPAARSGSPPASVTPPPLTSSPVRASGPSSAAGAPMKTEASGGASLAALPAMEVEATLYRSRGGARDPLPNGALVRPGDQLFVELQSSQPTHVYVLNEDQQGHIYLLFPLPGLDLANPLAAERLHRLPGSRQGALQDWRITDGQGAETFLLVAARQSIAPLEERIATLPQARPDQPVASAPFDAVGMLGHRGVGGLSQAIPASPEAGSTRLSAIARELAASNADPGGLWIRELSVHNLGR